MNCTKCGNELKPGQKFCTKCGTPVVAAATATESKAIGTTCPNCGNALKPGQKFCTKCGSPVAATRPQQVSVMWQGIETRAKILHRLRCTKSTGREW